MTQKISLALYVYQEFWHGRLDRALNLIKLDLADIKLWDFLYIQNTFSFLSNDDPITEVNANTSRL